MYTAWNKESVMVNRRGFFGWLVSAISGLFGWKPKEEMYSCDPAWIRAILTWDARPRHPISFVYLDPKQEIVGGVRRARPTMKATEQCAHCGVEWWQHWPNDWPVSEHDFIPNGPHYNAPMYIEFSPVFDDKDLEVRRIKAEFDSMWMGPAWRGPIILPSGVDVKSIDADLP